MEKFIKKYRLSIAGAILGAAGGFLYYHYIGCRTGSCPITSNPFMSILWGSVMGYLLFSMFENKNLPKKDNTENQKIKN
ncbi:MAG: DUF6132 family protein [Paludibacteraceae bacterium]